MITPEFRAAVRNNWTRPDGQVISLEVATLGLVGEVCEFDDALRIESKRAILLEAGDCLWYLVAIEELLGAHAPYDTRLWDAGAIMHSAATVAELVKKHGFHDRPQTDSIMEYLGLIRETLCNELLRLDFSLLDAQDANMEKLKKRYPHGFGR
jgi:NTP pyrophosphatase (non-canonical NTP hydrolase)